MMRWKTIFILALLIAGGGAGTFANDKGVWVGKSFIPKRCLEIAEGTWSVKHKLCTIDYDIRSQGDHFDIKGRLRFDEKFIPENVSAVELEILLIDENRVCTTQLNQRTNVASREADFSFTAENIPSQRYVRTYYIIYYR